MVTDVLPARTSTAAVLGDVDLAAVILAFLPTRDHARSAATNVAFAAASRRDGTWAASWPWRHLHPKPPYPLPSFRRAAALAAALEVAPPAFQGVQRLASDACAIAFTLGDAIIGTADGAVVVLPRITLGHTAVAPTAVTLDLHSGSVRHMQLVRRAAIGDPDAVGTPPASALFVGTWQGAVHSIGLPADAATVPTDVVTGLGGPVYALRVEGQSLYTCCSDGDVRIWSLTSGECVGRLCGHTGAVTDLAVAMVPLLHSAEAPAGGVVGVLPSSSWQAHRWPHGAECARLLVTTSYDGDVRVWDTTHRMCCLVLRGHRAPVWSVACCGSLVITGSADGTLRLWSLQGSLAAHAAAPGSSAALPHVAVAHEDVLSPWAVTHRKQILCVTVYAHILLAGGSDGSIIAWDLRDLSMLWAFDAACGTKDGVPVHTLWSDNSSQRWQGVKAR